MKTTLVLFAILLTSKVHGSLLDGLEHHGHHGDHHGEHGEHHGDHGEHHSEHHGEHDAQHGEPHADHGEQITQQEHHAEPLGEHHGEHGHADEHSTFQTVPPAQKDDFANVLASDISGGFLNSLPVAPARDVTPPARGVTTPPRDVTPPVRGITATPRAVTSPVRGVTTPPRAVTPPAQSFTTLVRDVTPPALDFTTPARAVTPTGRSFTSLDRTVTPPAQAVTTPPSAITPPALSFTTLDRNVTPPARGVTTLDRAVTPPVQEFVSTPEFADPAPEVAVHSAGVPPTESLVPPAPTLAEVFVVPASTPEPVDNFVTHTPAPTFDENLVQLLEEEQEEITPRENFIQKEDDTQGFVSSSGQGKQLASNDIRELQDVSGRSGSGDFPEYNAVPRTSFSCASQATGGYFADTEAQCQVFHICLNGQNLGSFLCPNGTLFHQEYFVCDWWFNVDCTTAPQSYGLNARIGVVPSDSE